MLTAEEWRALIDVCEILKKTFKKDVFQVTINPSSTDATEIFGIMLSFDQWNEESAKSAGWVK